MAEGWLIVRGRELARKLYCSLGRDLRESLATGAERDPAYSAVGAAWLLYWALAAAVVGLSLYLLVGYHAGFLGFNALTAQGPGWPWEWLTMLGDERVAFALTLLFARRHPRVFWTMVCAAVVAALYARGLKPLFDAARPPAVLAADAFNLLGPKRLSQSFPSGHSVTAAVFFGVLLYYARRLPWRLLLLSLALLAGLSRVAVGVHWPVDVAAGIAGGMLAAWAGVWLAAHSRWGIYNGAVHLALVSVAAIMALSLWFDNSGYTDATIALQVLSVVCLLYAALSYLLLPLWRARLRRSVQPRNRISSIKLLRFVAGVEAAPGPDVFLIAAHDQICQQSGPAGLVAGAEPLAGLGVEVLVEPEQVFPVAVGGSGVAAVEGWYLMVVCEAIQVGEALGDQARDLLQVARLAAEAGHRYGEVVAEEAVEALQRRHQRIVGRQPHRAAPVGVAAEHRRSDSPGTYSISASPMPSIQPRSRSVAWMRLRLRTP
jgi:membrane-associated phospholipid phosphatase